MLGDTARARALADAWAPRVAWQYSTNNGSCGGREHPFCASFGVMEMYTRIGAVEEGWRVAHRGSAWMYLSSDFGERRGVQHLDVHLAHASERERDRLLLTCTELGNRTAEQLAWTVTCARRLLERAAAGANASSEQERLRQRHAAATAAISVSERAARLGDAAVADEMLAHALASYAATQDAPLSPGERISLLEIAIFRLERAGRL